MTWGSSGIVYEADQRHAEVIVGRLGLKDKRSVITPGVKAENQKDEEGDDFNCYEDNRLYHQEVRIFEEKAWL